MPTVHSQQRAVGVIGENQERHQPVPDLALIKKALSAVLKPIGCMWLPAHHPLIAHILPSISLRLVTNGSVAGSIESRSLARRGADTLT
jgi:hypothetical protein